MVLARKKEQCLKKDMPLYEKHRMKEIEHFLAHFRLFFALFLLFFFFSVKNYIKIPLCVVLFFLAAGLIYSIFRIVTPRQDYQKRNLPPAVDLMDFVFLGTAVAFTGGIKSPLHMAYLLPICGGTIRYGFRGALSAFAIAIGITALQRFVPSHSFPPNSHLAAGFIILALATWMIAILYEKEEHLRDKMYFHSITDRLTGLYNVNYLKERVNEEINLCKRKKEAGFAIIFIDLDNFKKVNDNHGHNTGDKILEQVAQTLKNNTRGNEILTRYGGDELLLLLPQANKEQAKEVVKRLQKVMSSTVFLPESHCITIGISTGIAVYPKDGTSLEELIIAADRKMYIDKIIT